MLRVVLDTSSLVSYALTTGDIMSQLIAAWRAREFVLVISSGTRLELANVLSRPQIRSRAKVPLERLVEEIIEFAEWIPGLIDLPGVCRDTKDDIFLACAVEGKAHYLISSDRDLLDIGRFQTTCILNPGQFLVVLRLHQISPAEMKRRYSLEALQAIQRGLCLEPETAAKVAQAISAFN
jgi:putative PIN family toxin of toxin-antitoxin system